MLGYHCSGMIDSLVNNNDATAYDNDGYDDDDDDDDDNFSVT